MPALYSAVEIHARVEDAVVVVHIVDGSRDTVAEHAFCQARERVYGVVAEEGGRGGAVAFTGGTIFCLRGAELVEFVFRYTVSGRLAGVLEGGVNPAECSDGGEVGEKSELPPAMAPYPLSFSLSTVRFSILLGHALKLLLVSGSWKLIKKKGTLFSHGILLNEVRSGTAIKSLYPFTSSSP
jgi:hypothetical protein